MIVIGIIGLFILVAQDKQLLDHTCPEATEEILVVNRERRVHTINIINSNLILNFTDGTAEQYPMYVYTWGNK